MRGFRPQALGFGIGNRLSGTLNHGKERLKRRPCSVPALERVEFGVDFVDLGVESSQTFGMVAQRALELIASRGEIRERTGKF